MGKLVINNIPDDLLGELEQRALAEGGTAGDQALKVLKRDFRDAPRACRRSHLVDKILAVPDMTLPENFPSSEDLIREDRQR